MRIPRRLGVNMSSYVRPVPAHLTDDPAVGVARGYYIGGHGLLVHQRHCDREVTDWMIDYYIMDYQERQPALTVIELH